MTDKVGIQSLEITTAEIPAVTWRTDFALPQPELSFPADGARYCPEFTPIRGNLTGVTLSWNAVAGAAFYVLQLSTNQAFTGPNVFGLRTTALSKDLEYINHIRVNTPLYWRVVAYSGTGGASPTSEVRNIELACPQLQAIDGNPELAYGDTDAVNCDYIGADLKIVGGDSMLFGADTHYVLDVNWDCLSIDGIEVTRGAVAWSVRYPSAEVVDTVEEYDGVDGTWITINATDGGKPYKIDLEATVTFELYGRDSIDCVVRKTVTVNSQGGSGGTEFISFTITGTNTGLGLLSVACDFVLAEVTQVGCGGSSVAVGDEILLWDPDYCFFNMPKNLLIGLNGRAASMDNPLDPYTLESVSECQYEVLAEGVCRWVVVSLCCAEQYTW